MKKYGFWIFPENELYQEIESIIRKYSTAHKTPFFPPHLTIHGVVDSTDTKVIETTQGAVKNIQPFELELGDVEFSNTYFQSIFVRVKTSAKLLSAHMAISQGFGITEPKTYMPHISLVYGDFPMSKREKIAAEITLRNRKFTASKITIVRADTADPADWDTVGTVKLA